MDKTPSNEPLPGVFQLTPLKRACLAKCRSPLAFLIAHWREGRMGAFRMGALHGLWCCGCCSALMLLLFVGGVMNLAWAAALTIVTMVEKLVPRGERLAQAMGVALVAAGAWVLLHAALA